MFKPGSSIEDRLAAARVLGGQALVTLVRELVFANDVQSLRLLEDVGCFAVEMNDVEQTLADGRRRSTAMLQPDALPWVDAVVGLLGEDRFEQRRQRYKVDDLEGPVVDLEPATMRFLREVLHLTLRRLDALATGAVAQRAHRVRMATLRCVAVLGCATDDVEMVALSCEVQQAVAARQVSAKLIVPRSGWTCTPLAYAVHFQSLKVLQWAESSLLGAGVGKDDGDDGRVLSAGRFLGLRNGPVDSRVLKVLLDKLLLECQQPAEPDIDWISRDLVPNVCTGSWLYLLDDLLRYAPVVFELNRDVAELGAACRAQPRLMALLVPQARLLKLYALRSSAAHDEEPRWFWKEHPVARLVERASMAHVHQDLCDVDGTLLVLLQELVRRGQREDVSLARMPASPHNGIVHFCAIHACTATLLFLMENGFDLGVSNAWGKDPVQLAEQHGHAQTAGLIRSFLARHAAQQELLDTGR